MHTYLDMSSHLAVVAPIVPSLFAVLGPLLAVTLFTFVVAIPRGCLILSHWLWCRVAPASVRSKAVPGVSGQPFEGVVNRQFVDRYTFSVQHQQTHVRTQIVNFFEMRGARVRDGGDAITFERGNRLASYFLPHIIPWGERSFRQDISVTMKEKKSGHIEVNIQYIVQALCMLRVQPAGLQKEVGQLFRELNVAA